MPDDPNSYPALGRALLWVDRPGSGTKIFWALVGVCGALLLADLTLDRYGKFNLEGLPGFYGVFGFIAFTMVILGAKTLRRLIKRPEDYYGNKVIDAEDYPASGLDKADHDA